MATNPHVRKAGRYVRRLPGYRYARRAILPRIRQSPSARSLVKRVFDVDGSQVAPLDVAPGNLIGGVGTERLPVAVILLLGVPADRIEPIVDDVAQLQLLTAAFRPVIVLDTPQFAAVRRYGYPAELITAEHAWADEHQPWDEYARLRLGKIIATYRSSATITVGGEGLGHTDRLLLSSCAYA
ncbi:hypothetical protein G1H11_17815 [Phytoactinopolyspora alkaliphila]|uniref:Uncharacterized protein n=1 Tax=Phytoactinopolyspora alkaliphila TaxID=1783498 RepID=A0A6N9YQR7_9ACTN|nr:hypothetical protein [Phytoactinopolyspora alkaliphila]NED97159.1 hypothetical protein [Phytoactinopolyspora alkaliphila]